jgi:hypothetical protein
VWYAPDNPAGARIATSRLWLDPALTLLFGVGLLAILAANLANRVQ